MRISPAIATRDAKRCHGILLNSSHQPRCAFWQRSHLRASSWMVSERRTYGVTRIGASTPGLVILELQGFVLPAYYGIQPTLVLLLDVVLVLPTVHQEE